VKKDHLIRLLKEASGADEVFISPASFSHDRVYFVKNLVTYQFDVDVFENLPPPSEVWELAKADHSHGVKRRLREAAERIQENSWKDNFPAV